MASPMHRPVPVALRSIRRIESMNKFQAAIRRSGWAGVAGRYAWAGLLLVAWLCAQPAMGWAQGAAPAPGPSASAPAVVPPQRDAPCLECHDDLIEDPVVHKGLEKGCAACHGEMDKKRPHKVLTPQKDGLRLASTELCLSCHKPDAFKKKAVHKALEKGCLQCHEAHGSKHKKLLKSEVPKLCISCHKDTTYFGKGMHSATKSGKCSTCHAAHASDHAGLLLKDPVETCVECHDDLAEAPHVLGGFAKKGHPTGENAKPKPAPDPLRAGRPFSCTSCHEPHLVKHPKMLRFDMSKGSDVCLKCHPM